MNLNQDVKITRVANAAVSAETDINSSVLDMSGFEGVLFIALAGAVAASGTFKLKAQQDTKLAFDDDPQDLLGTLVGAGLVDADDNKGLALDIFRPREQFVRAVVTRVGTGGSALDSIVAIQYGPRKAPTVHDGTIKLSEQHQSPAEGTA